MRQKVGGRGIHINTKYNPYLHTVQSLLTHSIIHTHKQHAPYSHSTFIDIVHSLLMNNILHTHTKYTYIHTQNTPDSDTHNIIHIPTQYTSILTHSILHTHSLVIKAPTVRACILSLDEEAVID